MEKEEVFLPESEKNGKPIDLFFIWFAANLGILGIVYGAVIVSYGLSFLQSILIAIIGPLSFVLVGYISVAGKDSGATTFMLSRAPFGFKGNHIPALIGWVGQVGWLSINVSTGTLTLLALFSTFGFKTSTFLILMSLAIFAGLVIISVLFSQKILVLVQTFFTYVFGALTLLVITILITNTDWNALFSMKSGSWLKDFLPALAFVIVGTGLTWTNAAADYSRFQKKSNSSLSIITSVTAGAFIPLFIIISTGILLATSEPQLANAENPILLISEVLPNWMTVIYLISALGGLTPMCFLGLKSSRLIMSTFDLKVKNSTVIIIHSIIIIAIPIYVLVVSRNFLAFFEMFLEVLGIGLAAWSAIFIVDYATLRKNVGYEKKLVYDPQYNSLNIKTEMVWSIAVIVGALINIFTSSSFDIIVTFMVSGFLYYIFNISLNTHRKKAKK